MAELTKRQAARLNAILSNRRSPGVYTAVKYYTVLEESTKNMWYSIVVKNQRGEVVESILKPTQREAQEALAAAGYRVING